MKLTRTVITTITDQREARTLDCGHPPSLCFPVPYSWNSFWAQRLSHSFFQMIFWDFLSRFWSRSDFTAWFRTVTIFHFDVHAWMERVCNTVRTLGFHGGDIRYPWRVLEVSTIFHWCNCERKWEEYWVKIRVVIHPTYHFRLSLWHYLPHHRLSIALPVQLGSVSFAYLIEILLNCAQLFLNLNSNVKNN